MNSNYDEILNYVEDFQKKFNLNINEPIKDIFSIVDSSFLVLKFPNKMGISGIYIEKKGREKNYKCIYINTREPLGRQNFTFAHELFHVFYKKSTSGVCLENDRESDNIEKEAEMFASNLLIPRFLLLTDLKKRNLNTKKEIKEEHIFFLQMKYNVTYQAIVYAIEDIKKHEVYKSFYNYIPIIPNHMKQYYKSSWDKLSSKAKTFNSALLLNSVNPVYEFPQKFKSNLLTNYSSGLIYYDELKEIFSFFNSEKELEVYL